MVFSNKNLLEVAMHRPTSLETLAQIEGITDARISKFGQQIVDFVESFCKGNKLEENSFCIPSEEQKVSMKNSDFIPISIVVLRELVRLMIKPYDLEIIKEHLNCITLTNSR